LIIDTHSTCTVTSSETRSKRAAAAAIANVAAKNRDARRSSGIENPEMRPRSANSELNPIRNRMSFGAFPGRGRG